MRSYSKVSPDFWIDEMGKRRRKSAEEQLVALYLMTNPHCNPFGLYYLPVPFLEHETGLGKEGASKGLRLCIEDGFCGYDEGAEIVWVFGMAAAQLGELKPGDKRATWAASTYCELPENRFLAAFFDRYGAALHLGARRGGGGTPEPDRRGFEAPSEGHRSKEMEIEVEGEKESEGPAASPRNGGSAPGPPARGVMGPRMLPPSEEEWVAYARATWPEWAEHDIRSSWAHYERTLWKGVSVWKACAKTCYHKHAGKVEAQQARALVGSHRPAPARPQGREVDEESPLWVIGVYKALMHPSRPVVPDDLEEAWERWRKGEDVNGREPDRWRERVEEALTAAIEEDARMAVGNGRRR